MTQETVATDQLKDTSLEQRLAMVLECVKSAGFDDVEQMLSQYYTSDLSKVPPLANAQRLSRKRRLPNLLANVAEDMNKWTKWEAQGCKEEMIRSAEQIFLGEYRETRKSRQLHDYLAEMETTIVQDPDLRGEAVTNVLSDVGGVLKDEVRLIPQSASIAISHYYRSYPIFGPSSLQFVQTIATKGRRMGHDQLSQPFRCCTFQVRSRCCSSERGSTAALVATKHILMFELQRRIKGDRLRNTIRLWCLTFPSWLYQS